MKQTKKREEISRRLREAVLNSGMTYLQIGQQVGTPTNVIASYMGKDRRLPSLGIFGALCRALGVSADEVLGVGEGK